MMNLIRLRGHESQVFGDEEMLRIGTRNTSPEIWCGPCGFTLIHDGVEILFL